jgi:hypothetical protein
MLPTSYFTAWGPGALYAELYIGMCQALTAPWLSPWVLGRRSGAQACSPAARGAPTEAAVAEPTPAATDATPQPPCTGASIIPFDRARARRAGGPEAATS